MPYEAHTRVVMNGTLGDQVAPFEIWSMGLALDGAGDFQTQQQADQIGTICQNYFSNGLAGIAPLARLREVAVSQVGVDGKQIGETLRVPMNVPGGGNASLVPAQIAYRVSIGSGLRGRSQRGGWYVPVPTFSPSSTTGQISEAAAGGACEAALAFLLSFQGNLNGRVCVPSGVAGNVPVNEVRVGRVLDTIRRRRNAIPEAYIGLPVPS